MASEFLLVEWSAECKYSVVPRDKIVSQLDRDKSDVDLIGTEIEVYWGRSKKKHYLASVIQCGLRIDLEYELEQLINSEKSSNKASSIHVSNEVSTEIHNVLSQLPEDNPVDITSDDQQNDWKEKYEEMKTKAHKYKNKVKTLKRKLREYEETEQMENIGSGVVITKSQLDTIKTVSNTPNTFARNLTRCVFKTEELVGHSLFGRRCNANKTMVAKPSIDPAKRDAIIFQTLAQFGGNLQGNQVGILKTMKNSMLSQIHSSLGDLLREITTKATIGADN